MAAGLAAMLGIESQDDLLRLVEEATAPALLALAEDLPSAATSSILALVVNPEELVMHLGFDPQAFRRSAPSQDTLKVILVASTMIMQELDKRIPPRVVRAEMPIDHVAGEVLVPEDEREP